MSLKQPWQAVDSGTIEHFRNLLCPLLSCQLYADAEQALDSIADRMEASRGPFFLGPEPCSVDALLVGVLLHMQRSPAALPALREKVRNC